MRQSKDQSGLQDRLMPKHVPEEKGKPLHKKGQSMCQKKRANRPTRKATVCASKKGQPAHKKDHSMCQQKWLTILQERPKYAPEQTSMRPTRKANAPNAHQRKKGFSETLKVTVKIQSQIKIDIKPRSIAMSKSKSKSNSKSCPSPSPNVQKLSKYCSSTSPSTQTYTNK
ncbi:hypothetical protein PHYBLDRAFT_153674 [Phycomyces blakesleeanus NRRL 1555(-)]|uniref:Uncharacterized protein n=1 Tax=Phycomyces blakesleeanus (strain ATCC 8743b / DSM 1359 / FGSC 10004 / NBRC 33097 / NRRL 1555) TaxID=763407 RepID=A0A162T9M6_PHYB8|nr:hypothetical protein PHYBLDRAFT_153674 [Phycomyces blakesleeanus NRRL 1555(-)]OAD65283.1 hypothetical protein PHYBLDRAFT_153674 [Phycomyces blakesleeanus NRRL 1555(-)]|eukprot:XP_018283323.1 hypothetical protein PHYBLDRAFT_153674 [Phycomyces blakesleeanus NRRL 1555(-)]